MAVSVRIEDEAFSDMRVELLGSLAGYNRYEALGRLAHLWRICTQRHSYVVSDSIVNACIGPAGVQHMLDAELAERVSNGIRVRGTAGRIEWLAEIREKRQAGGIARIKKAQRDGAGRLLAAGSSTHPAHAGQPSSTQPAQSSAPAPAPANEEEEILPDPKDHAIAVVLMLRVIGNHPGNTLARLEGIQKTKRLNKWADHIRLMRQVDKHSEADIKAVIAWCQSDPFWRKNILSAEKLREKWDQLVAQMGSKAPRPTPKTAAQPTIEFPIGDCEVLR